MTAPKGFCEALPFQPRIWDPSFLAVAATCWRKHWLQTVRGLRRNGEPSVHLTWGKAYHASVEEFDRALLAGYSRAVAQEEALEEARRQAASAFWGETIETWRCTDPELVPAQRVKVWQNRKTGMIIDAPPAAAVSEDWELVPKLIPNRSRCPHARGAQPLVDEGWAPPQCPNCGADVKRGSTFIPYHPKKTGETLIAAVRAYCDSASSITPFAFEDGTAGLELQARLPLPIISPDAEPYEILVNIDSLVSWEDDIAIRERKTTGLHIESPKVAGKFWLQWEPNIQIDTYDLVGSVLYADADGRPPKIIVEALCIANPEHPFVERREIHIPEGRRAEWFRELQHLIQEAGARADDAHLIQEAWGRADDAQDLVDPSEAFPRNTTACRTQYGVCPFLILCQAAPNEREGLIAAAYHVERWVPEDAAAVSEEESE